MAEDFGWMAAAELSFDPANDAKHLAERGLPFVKVAAFEWATASVIEGVRKGYGERRLTSWG